MAVDAKTKYDLKKFVKNLKKYKGRHTEMISVYISAGFDVNITINQLQQEAGTASNIKSAQTRNNVITSLEKMIQFLKGLDKTPENGLAVFSGNVTEREGQEDFQVFHIEPPVPLNQKLYRCDKTFVTEPLEEMVQDKESYGLVVLDQRDATLALLKGKTIVPIKTTHSEVPGKMRAGGQCLSKDTLILKSDGTIRKLSDVSIKNKIKSYSKNMKDSEVLDKWKKVKSKVIITTKWPRIQIESSNDHTFFVQEKGNIVEKMTSQLKEGDKLLMPEKVDIKGKNQKIPSLVYSNRLKINEKGRKYLIIKRNNKNLFQKELAKKANVTQSLISFYEIGKNNPDPKSLSKICGILNIDSDKFMKNYCLPLENIKLPKKIDKIFSQFLGYLAGDGSIETDRITFYEQEKESAKKLKNLFENYFEINSSYKFREQKNYYQIRFVSRPLVRMIKNEFKEIKKALDTRIPDKVLSSSNSVLAGFIKGIFDAESFVTKRGLSLSINNKIFAKELQLSLLRFSVISSIYEYDNNENKYSNNPKYTIDITEKQSLINFKNKICLTSSRKKELLSNLIKNKTERSYVRQTISYGVHIKNIVEKPIRKYRLPGFFAKGTSISKHIFKEKIIKHTKNDELKNILMDIYNNPLIPVEIKTIKKTKQKVEMIDISTNEKNFFANGLLVHNSAPRFQRLRADAINSHYKKIAEYMKDEFLHMKDLKGIILGGPGTTVKSFMLKDHVTGDLKKKIIGTKDLSYTGEFGLQELLERAEDILAEEDVAKEKVAVSKFFEMLATDSLKVAYGLDDVKKALDMGAVDKLLLSEQLEDDVIEEFEIKAEEFGTEVQLISTETREGEQLFRMGKIAALLRFPVA